MSTSDSEPLSREESLQKLEALFANSNIPAARPAQRRQSPRSRPNMAGEGERVVFSNPRKSIGRAPSEFRLKLERLRIARSQEELEEAADAFLSQHQLPDDPGNLAQGPSAPVGKGSPRSAWTDFLAPDAGPNGLDGSP